MKPKKTETVHNLPGLPASRRHKYQTHPILSIVAILRSAPGDLMLPPDSYLMIQRIKPPYLHQWAMVGGKWEFGESLQQAIIREVLEETGLKADFVSLRGIMNERLHSQDDQTSGGHYILFICELQVRGGNAVEQCEGPVSWFSYSTLKQMATDNQVIATDFALLNLFRDPLNRTLYIEAEVESRTRDNHNEDTITRFEVTGSAST